MVDKSPTPAAQPLADIKTLLLDSLETRWNNFAQQVSKSHRNPTEKSIHDLRVSMRRVIVLLEMTKPITAKNRRIIVLKELKGYIKSLSPLRDIQVQILFARKLRKDFPIMSSYLATLATIEKSAVKQARREISRINTNFSSKNLQNLKMSLASYLSEDPMMEMAQPIIRGELLRSFVQALFLRSEITNDKDGDDKLIHELRIAFKHFRYMVEVLQPTLPRVTIKTMKSMNRFQLRMGNIQDTGVLIDGLDRYVAKIRKIERALFTPVRSFLNELRDNRIHEFIRSVDELYNFWECIR